MIHTPALRNLGRLFGQAQRTVADPVINKKAVAFGEGISGQSNKEEVSTVSEDTADQRHLGRMPLEILQRIGSFAAPCLANQDVNSIISAHLDKPKIESREASGSSSSSSAPPM